MAWAPPISRLLPSRRRASRSPEETALYPVCAEVADIGFKAVCDALRPGMAEHELSAELDYAMKRNGAEETFTLMSSGRFSFENNAPFLNVSVFEGSGEVNGYKVKKGDLLCALCKGEKAELSDERLYAAYDLASSAFEIGPNPPKDRDPIIAVLPKKPFGVK